MGLSLFNIIVVNESIIMNVRLILNIGRIIASIALLVAGIAFYYDSNTTNTNVEFYLSTMICSIFVIGGSLLAFLPYERIK
jgi:uncharacterized protein YqgC (DUF456 family)